MSIKLIIVFIAIASGSFFSFGCSKLSKELKEPQEVLSEYVTRTFSVKTLSDKEKLLELTTGEVKKSLEGMSEGNFRKTFIESKRDFSSIKILEKRKISDSEMAYTYELTYLDKTFDNNAKIINKKFCNFKKIEGKWKISDCKNEKTFIESTQEITIEGTQQNLP